MLCSKITQQPKRKQGEERLYLACAIQPHRAMQNIISSPQTNASCELHLSKGLSEHPLSQHHIQSNLLHRQLPKNPLENILTLVKIDQSQPLIIQMRRITGLSTREMRSGGSKFLF